MQHTLKTWYYNLSTFAIFLLVQTSMIGQGNCDAAFFGEQNGNFGITFYNISSGVYTATQWNFGDGTTSSLPTAVPHYYTASGTYQVCLTISNVLGCQSTVCQPVTFDAQGLFQDSTCYFTDCVFPGDVNYDEVVNAYDVLPIALNFGATGTPRPNASLNFVGQASTDWLVTTSDSMDLKHVDADGDGQIGFGDLLAVQQNFSFIHDGITQKSADGLPLWVQFDPIVYPQNPTDPFQVSAGIMLGSATDPATDVYALAFILEYDHNLVEPGSVTINFNNNSFLAAGNTPIQMSIDDSNTGQIAMAKGRTDHNLVNGFGRLATVNFTITDIVIGREDQVKFELNPKFIKGVDTLGTNVSISGLDGVIIFNTTATDQVQRVSQIGVFPNPASEQVVIDLGNVRGESIEIFDAFGRRMISTQVNRSGQVTVPVKHLNTGLYTLTIRTREGTASRRLFIK